MSAPRETADSSGLPSRRARAGAVLFATLGAALLAWLIARSNPAELWSAVERGAAFLPVLVAIEGIRLAVEAWGTRKLYERPIRFPLLLRATFVAYAVATLAPAGRASGETVKAGMLRKHTRLSDTAAAATTIQTCSLVALGFWSLVCAAVALPISVPLAGTFALQLVLVLVAALAVRGGAATSVLGRTLGRVWPKAGDALGAVRGRARLHRMGEPLAALVLSRGLELVQFAVIFFTVTRRLAIVPALLTFGVATLAGTIGDSVPVQLGVIGASFTAAAPALGISIEDAVAFGLLAHGFHIAWIAVGLLTPVVWRVPPEPPHAGSAGGVYSSTVLAPPGGGGFASRSR